VAEQPAIIAEGLGKRFGQLQALAGVDLQVRAGAVVAVLGPNGAGKTTMVRILCTLLRPDSGRAAVAGLDVVRQAAAVRRVIGLSGQYAAVDSYLTGRENLRMIGRLSGLGRGAARRRADELLELFGLAGTVGRAARTYSGGMRRRLDVAASLVAAPRVLFLDEPTTGLDPRGRAGLWALLAELAAQGTSLLLTTQYLEEADRLADAIVVIDAGRVIATGTSAELKARAGGDRLDVQALPGDDLAALAAVLAGLGSGPPILDRETGRLVIPVTEGPGILPEVATRLAAAGLRIADLALRRPTLDDVFLTLTGQPGAPPGPARAGAHAGRDDPAPAGPKTLGGTP
jgi:daunorubicin resistance ABC transporter ATP-binding subunit